MLTQKKNKKIGGGKNKDSDLCRISATLREGKERSRDGTVAPVIFKPVANAICFTSSPCRFPLHPVTNTKDCSTHTHT